MSKQIAILAATAAVVAANADTQGFCVEYKGLQVCNEQIEAALESEKINITGCVAIGGVQVCKNSEETFLFDEEESQGFCVEYKGIKVCKEQIDAALESEKINITGCVKIGGVQVCKNAEESVFDESQDVVVKAVIKRSSRSPQLARRGFGVFEADEDDIHVAQRPIPTRCTGYPPPPHAQRTPEEEAEQVKFDDALKTINKAAQIAASVGVFEGEIDEEQKIRLRGIAEGVIKAVQVAQASVGLLNDNFEEQKFKLGKILKGTLKAAKFAGAVGLLEEQQLLEAEQFKMGQKLANAAKVAQGLAQLELDGQFEDEQLNSAFKKLRKPAVKRVEQQLLEEEASIPTLTRGDLADWFERAHAAKIAKKAAQADKKAQDKAERNASKLAKKSAQLPSASSFEEHEDEGDQGEQKKYCVDWNGVKVCEEEIQAALESEKINITGCVKIGGVQVCKNAEEMSPFDKEDEDAEEQGFCVEYKGIKVCKEEIEAALDAYEQQGLTGVRCSSVSFTKVCVNSEQQSVFESEDQEQHGITWLIKNIFSMKKY